MDNGTKLVIIKNEDYEIFGEYLSFLNKVANYLNAPNMNMDMNYALEELVSQSRSTNPEDLHMFIKKELAEILRTSNIMDADEGWQNEGPWEDDNF